MTNLDGQPIWDQYQPKAPLPFFYERAAKPAVIPQVAPPEPPPAKKILALDEGFFRPHPYRPIVVEPPRVPPPPNPILTQLMDTLPERLSCSRGKIKRPARGPYSDENDWFWDYDPPYNRDRATALQYPMIELNDKLIKGLVTDLDYNFKLPWCHPTLPTPNWIARNPENGHCHLVWLLAKPLWRDAKPHKRIIGKPSPVHYYEAIQKAYNKELKGDTDYHGGLTKNPLHNDWDTTFLTDQHYTLRELAGGLDLRQPRKAKLQAGDSRYDIMFNTVRLWAYANRQNHDSYESLYDAVWEQCEIVNGTFAVPKPESDIKSTTKSITNYTWNKYTPRVDKNVGVMHLDKKIPYRVRCQMGQGYRCTVIKIKNFDKLHAAYTEIQTTGAIPTKTAVVKLSGLSLSTVKRYWGQLTDKDLSVSTNRVCSDPPYSKSPLFGVEPQTIIEQQLEVDRLGGNARLGQPDGISPSRMAEMLEVDKAGPNVRC
jgi:Replicase family